MFRIPLGVRFRSTETEHQQPHHHCDPGPGFQIAISFAVEGFIGHVPEEFRRDPMHCGTAMRFRKHSRFRQRQFELRLDAASRRNDRYADRQDVLSAGFASVLNGKNVKGWAIGQIDSRIVVVLA